MVEIIWEPINPTSVYKKIKQRECGSVVIHYGLVRKDVSNVGKTFYIEFEPTQKTMEELETVATEIKNKWVIEDILIIRRMGKVKVGEIVLAVAVSAIHRKEAFSACAETIDQLKQSKTIKKNEVFI